MAYPVTGLTDPFDDTIDGVEVTVTPHGFGASVARLDGRPIGTRTAFWFAIVTTFAEVEVRTP